MLRLAHISDVHLTASPLGWRRRDFISKKVTGWANVKLLGRGRRFKHSLRIVDQLRQDICDRGCDQIVFSGDATKLAFENEFRVASERLGVNDPNQTPGFCVPGNHDYYTRAAFREGYFERYFLPWMQGKRIDDSIYPYAKKVGHAWLIGLNSSSANWWTFDASGTVGHEQLMRFRKLCEMLDDGPRIVVTHYPLRTRRRKLERRSHRLRDYKLALECARDCGISLWLHGHIHTPYFLKQGDDLPFPTICAGSCTQTNRWCYNQYLLDDRRLQIQQRIYRLAEHRFDNGYSFELELP